VTSIGKRRSPARIPTEHAEQVAFVKWFRLQFPKVRIFAIPNGGARHIVAAKKLKDEGVERGVADLFVPRWNLWIEMKRSKSGALSPEQRAFGEYVSFECGHDWILANGAEHGREMIIEMYSGNLRTAASTVEKLRADAPKIWSGTSLDKLR
jgi:hypothetical protein